MKSLHIIVVAFLLSVGKAATDSICPFASDSYAYVVYPYDCAKYYECFNGSVHLMECPQNLYWNEETEACDSLEHVDCTRTSASPSSPTTSPDDWSPDPACPYPSYQYVYLVYPYDCAKYYECYQGNKFLMSCPNNLYWNYKITGCDELENVDCPIISTSTSVPDSSTASTTSPLTTYSTSSDSTSEPPTTPASTTAVPTTSSTAVSTTYSTAATTETTEITSTPTTVDTSAAISSTSVEQTTAPASATLSPVPEASAMESVVARAGVKININAIGVVAPDPMCPNPSTEIVYFPDPYDCTKYYECYAGNRFVMDCPTGLYWNQGASACDFPVNVDCTTISSSSVRPTVTTVSPTTSSWHPNPACPYPSNQYVYLVDPNDCARYYECYEGNLSIMNCPANLYWNDRINSCDQLENVDCSRNTPTTVAPTTSSWSPDPSCPYPSSQFVYLIDPYDCARYYECYEGNKYTMECPPSLYWNDKINTCDRLSNVDCSRNVSSTTVAPTTGGWSPDPACPYPSSQYVYLVDPSDCAKYYECYQGNKFIMDCPAELYWNDRINSCDTIENVDCSRNITTVSPPTSVWTPDPMCPYPSDEIVYYIYPSDCSRYYMCYNGHKDTLQCGTNLYWNDKINSCDFLPNVDCSRSSSTVSPVTVTSTTSTPRTTPTTTPSGNICDGIPNGTYLPNPTDCAKYYECDNGEAKDFTCPANTLWNPAINTCDFPADVDCKISTN